ncbi:MAG: hypothetical protein O2968_14410 [Acidobacteria bacterium]|nr:hypothetical protein [Acidobacteriota bacterium]
MALRIRHNKIFVLTTLLGALLLPPLSLTAQTTIAVTDATQGQGLFPVAPGSLATASSIGGNFVGIPGGAAGIGAETIPLPFNLQGVVVEVDGLPAALLFAREGNVAGGIPGQINFQVSWGTAFGRVPIRVLVNGVEVASGFMNVTDAAPALFAFFDGGNPRQGIISNSDFSLNGPDNRAQRGSFLIAWGTGPGPFDVAVADGDIPPAGTLPAPELDVVCYLSVAEVVPATALQSAFVGLWQINIPIPNLSYLSGEVPLFCMVRTPGSATGIPTNTVKLWIAE